MSVLRDILNRPLAGRISTNLGWLLAEKCLRLFSSLIVGVWVARHLGAEAFGVLSYCLALLALFGCLGTLGTDGILKRELLLQPAKEQTLLASAAFLRVLAAGAAILFTFVWAFAFVPPTQRAVLLLAGGALLVPLSSMPDLHLQAHLNGRGSFVAGAVATIVGAIGRVLCILLDAPLWMFAAMVSVEALVLGVALWSRLRAIRGPVQLKAVDASVTRSLLRDSLPLLVAGIAVTLYTRIDQVMLESMRGTVEVGIYSAAIRISEMANFVPMVLAAGLFPSLVSAHAASREEFKRRAGLFYDLNVGVAFLFVVPVALFAGLIVALLFGEGYSESAPVLAVHVWSVVFVFLGVARGQVLTAEGVILFQTVATSAGALLNIGLNALLIPSQGAVGAAWATVVSYAVAAWISGLFNRRTRTAFVMQARALLVPLLGWRHFFRP